MHPARLLLKAANVKIVELVGIDQFQMYVMASTKCTSSNIQNFMKSSGDARSVNKRSSVRASKATRQRASEPASRGSRARSVDQQAIDVGPIILGHRRDFTQVLKQSEDRGASIKFYGPRAGGLALSDKYEITFCHGRMKQYLMG